MVFTDSIVNLSINKKYRGFIFYFHWGGKAYTLLLQSVVHRESRQVKILVPQQILPK